MKQENIKDLWKEATNGDNTHIQMIPGGGAEKAKPEEQQTISGDDPLLKFVIKQWDIAAETVEKETGCKIVDA